MKKSKKRKEANHRTRELGAGENHQAKVRMVFVRRYTKQNFSRSLLTLKLIFLNYL
jgi:hypothetical protein